MLRRRLLEASGWLGGAALLHGLIPRSVAAQQAAATRGVAGAPIVLRLGGYGPPTTSHSQGLRLIGDRLAERFGSAVDIRYTYNILEAGYVGQDLAWMVDRGLFGIVYATLATGVPALDVAALPFVFRDAAAARAAMAGPLGEAATRSIEASRNCRVLGYFENGFRHVSNNRHPVRRPEDLRGLKIRVLPMQLRTFELLGADPRDLNLAAGIEAIRAGTIDGQENPFANVVTYEIHALQRYYTATHHSYLSRPLLVHRPSFDAWPAEFQAALRDAAREAVALQHRVHDDEEAAAEDTIRAAGGEILHLTPEEHQAFVAAVEPLFAEASAQFPRALLRLIGM
jgi:TRAP-type C4-dicarboxylate transport system substrate-binding protein